MQSVAPIPVYRPSYLTDGLEFQGSLVESPANVFYQRVKASRASLVGGSGRMQFQWRSVSDNLLMSPTVMLRFQLKIQSPIIYDKNDSVGVAITGNESPKPKIVLYFAKCEGRTYQECSRILKQRSRVSNGSDGVQILDI